MKPIAIFDIDGTIFRSSLVIELFKKLVQKDVFEAKFLRCVQKSERKWLNREGHYDNYVFDVVEAYRNAIVGKRKQAIITASREVVREQKFRTYRFTRKLLEKIRGKYFTIGISGSPLEVVAEYNQFLKFQKIFGTEFGLDERGRYTDVVLHVPPRYKKELIVRYVQSHNLSLTRSIGVGDTEADIGFLELVDQPICFNPNSVLARTARQKNWTVVIERKDLTLELKLKRVKMLRV